MIIGGKKFDVHLDDISIEKLEPDLNQPRRYELERELASKGLDPKAAKTPKGIEMARRFQELTRAIIENEGISMPLVVEKTNDHYKILEGDRRKGAAERILADEQTLNDKPILKERLSKLPCLVLEGPLSDKDRLRLLAHIHIHLTSWRPIAKQKVIMDLREKIGDDDKVAAVMGVSSSAISATVAVEEMAKKFSFKGPASISYAKGILALRKDLIDQDVVEATVKKVKEGKITSPVHLRKLKRVLEDHDARKVYLKPPSTIDDAEGVLKAKEFKKTLEESSLIEFDDLLERLVLSLKNVRFEDLVKYKGSKEIRQTIDDAMNLLSKIKAYV